MAKVTIELEDTPLGMLTGRVVFDTPIADGVALTDAQDLGKADCDRAELGYY